MIHTRLKRNSNTGLKVNQTYEGETIEQKIFRIIHNGESTTEVGVQKLYTERKEGVLPSTNIRTDRFEVAIEGMDKVEKSYKARREERAKFKVEKGTNYGDISGAEPIQGTK